MSVPVVNPTDAVIIIPLGGHTWLFPPEKSRSGYMLKEVPGGIGVSPFQVTEVGRNTKGCVRGPVISVPPYVATELRTNARCIAAGSAALKIGSQVLEDQSQAAQAAVKAREEVEAELTRLRAELEAEKLKATRVSKA